MDDIEDRVCRIKEMNETLGHEEEKWRDQCLNCEHRIGIYEKENRETKFCGPDPTTWYYHECGLQPDKVAGNGKFESCQFSNREGKCPDFKNGTTYNPPWTYFDLDSYREYLIREDAKFKAYFMEENAKSGTSGEDMIGMALSGIIGVVVLFGIIMMVSLIFSS